MNGADVTFELDGDLSHSFASIAGIVAAVCSGNRAHNAAAPAHSKPLAGTHDGIAVSRPINTLAGNGGLQPYSSRPQTGHHRNPMPASVRASVRAASRSVFDGKALTENRPGPHIASNSGQVSLAKR